MRRILTGAAIAIAVVLCLSSRPGSAGDSAGAPPAPGAPPQHESEGRLLVVNKGDDSLMVFDVPSHTLVATVPVDPEPHEVAVTPDGRKAYVSSVRGKSLSIVDLKHYKVTATLKPDRVDYPHGMAVTPDGRRLLLTGEGSRRLYLIDTTRDVVERAVTTSQSGSHMVVLAKEGRRAWIANRESESLSLYDLPTMRLIKTVKAGPGPEGIALSPNGRWVVTALQRAGQVAIIDAAQGQIVTRLPAGQTPIRVACPPKGLIALVSNRDSDDLTIIDLAARQVLKTVPVGRRPGGVTTNLRGTRAYVSNTASGTVSIVALPGYEVTGTIAVGRNPDGIAFVPAPAHAPDRPPKRTKSGGGS